MFVPSHRQPDCDRPSCSALAAEADPRNRLQPGPEHRTTQSEPWKGSGESSVEGGGGGGGLHLLVGVQHGQQQVLWAKLSALLLQREARQQAALLVVALGRLLAQPLHGERVGLAGTQRS